MSDTPHYSLSWSEHLSNISNGLSSLQQNEEFVDMTLAADGHYIKVHKIIMALSSPYIKEIISSMECEHPIIYLNNVNYNTLTAILEYIYTGEVFVQSDNINEFIKTARDLHIRGLKDLKVMNDRIMQDPLNMETLNKNETDNNIEDITLNTRELEDIENTMESKMEDSDDDSEINLDKDLSLNGFTTLHYTISNRGSLQMILNNFLYYLKHTNKDMSRQWRCVDYLNNWKCPASIFTKHDMVVQRIAAHNHPVHNSKITKKFRTGLVYTAIKDVMEKGLVTKTQDNNDRDSP